MSERRPDPPKDQSSRHNEETLPSEAISAPSIGMEHRVTKPASDAPPPLSDPPKPPSLRLPESSSPDETTNWSPSKLAAVVAATIDAPAPPSDATADWSNLPGAGTGVVKPKLTGGSFPTDAPTMARDMKDMTADFDVVTPNSYEKRQMVPTGAPRVDGYEVLDVLGRGGMGIVFKARQSGLDRLVALKMVLAGADARPDEIERFKTEAKAVARLNHENIVQIFDVGERDGTPYFSLEYVDGGNLGKKVDKTPQPPKDAALMVEKLARAMHVAHEKGIVHRDLKPANILLTAGGEPKITDFGLAKLTGSDSGKTRDGSIMGTPSYMAPEQARGLAKEIGPPTDIYSLGAVLYDLLAGRPPFQGTTVLETLDQVRSQEPVPPTDFLPKTPKDLETITLKCLQKEPQKRYESANALADDLRRYLEGRPILARRISASERLWRWCRRNPVIASLLAASFLLLATVAVVSTASAFAIAQERDKTEAQRLIAVKNEQQAVTAKNEAVKNLDLAEKNASTAISSVSKLLFDFQQVLGERVEMQGIKRVVLENAYKSLDELANQTVTEEQTELTKRRTAQVHNLRGRLADQIGNQRTAMEEFQKAHAIIEALYQKSQNFPAPYNLAVITDAVAQLQRDYIGDYTTARRLFERSRELRQQAMKQKPDEEGRRVDMANAYGNLAITNFKAGDAQQAEIDLQESLHWWDSLSNEARELPGNKLQLAGLWERVGEAAFKQGRAAESVVNYEKALHIREEVEGAVRAGNNKGLLPAVLRNIALAHLNLGDVSLFLERDPKASEHEYKLAQSYLDEADKLLPDTASGLRVVSNAQYRLGVTHEMLEQLDLSKQELARCVELRRKLVKGDEEGIEANAALMTALARSGDHQEAAAIADEVVKRAPNEPRFLFEASCTYSLCQAAVKALSKSGQTPPLEAGELATQYGNKAIASIKQAIDRGWKDAITLHTDPDLDSAREDPRFQEIVQSLDRSGITLPEGLKRR
jgi:serine/threonine-protein kinase